jgi:Mlc titration factor MtfA (ptsG expression regulator)
VAVLDAGTGLIMFGWWRRRRRRKVRAQPLPPAWPEILARTAPFVARLRDADRTQLFGDVQVFLAEKHFVGAGGLEITDEIRVTVAASAVRLTLHLDIDLYDDLTEIVVYPEAYRHPGVADTAVLGEAHSWGTVVLSWRAVLDGLSNPRDGHDTAVHEFAHVLDRVSGAFDGAPPLATPAHYEPWAAAMSRHYERLRRGDKQTRSVLRDYGATNEAEFFAVATEAFFERPERLRQQAPDLFEELRRFYGGDPP